MLFFVRYKEKAGYTHEDQKKQVNLWVNFQPPEGFDIQQIYALSGGAGFALIEAPTAEILFDGLSLWAGVLLDYEIAPAAKVESAVESVNKAITIRASA